MNYSLAQLSSGRYGIYAQRHLLATIGCLSTAQKIFLRLQTNSPIQERQRH